MVKSAGRRPARIPGSSRRGHEPEGGLPTQKKILLRLFVHFHGDKIILLLHGYDKGGNDSQRQQNKEIQEARKRLTAWKAAEAKRAKDQKK